MAGCSSAEYDSYKTRNVYPDLGAILLHDQQQFTFNKINEIKN